MMLRVLLGFLITVVYVFGFPQKSGSLQETFQALQNLQQQQSQQGSQSSNRPGTNWNNQQRPTSGNNQQRPTTGNNQQRPTTGNNQQGYDVFNGPGAQGSTSNSVRPNGNQQGFGNSGSQIGTTVRSPLNVVSNELTIPESSCVQKCMAVSTYDPVCGSDDITYTNRGKFRCAQNCGRRVSEAYRGACVTTPSPN